MTSISSWLNVRPSRGTAFVIHLLASLLVFSSLVAVMLVYWFPGDLFIIEGGWEGLKLVAMVDLVLGPLLTLVLFKPGKPGLKVDLSIIAAIQIAALGYGFYATYIQRTVAVVFAENKFSTVSAQDKRDADQVLLGLELQPGVVPSASAFSVPLLRTPAAEDMGTYLQELFSGFPAAHARSDQYVALEGSPEDIKRYQISMEDLRHAGALQRVEEAISSRGLTMDNLEIYEFKARYADGYALYHPQRSRIIDYVRYERIATKSDVAQSEE